MKKLVPLIAGLIFSVSASAQLNCNTVNASMSLSSNSLTATLVNNSTPTATSNIYTYYSIHWGDNSSTYKYDNTNTAHNYSSPGTYTVTLYSTVLDSLNNITCHDTTSSNITVAYAPCASKINIQSSWGGNFTFNAPNLANTPNLTFAWNFGDNTTGSGATVSHTYSSPGSYTVTMVASNGNCTSTYTQKVYVGFKNCWPDSTSIGMSPSGLNVNFTNLTMLVSSGKFVASRKWYFGDGNTSTAANPSHTYASTGTYVVSLVTTFQDSSTQATCKDSTSSVLVLTAINKIRGYIIPDSSKSQVGDSFKVWLITFDSSTNILAAVDSQIVSGQLFYEFTNKAAGTYRTKAALINGPSSGTGMVPTYHYSSLLWSQANAFTHNGNVTQYQNISMKTGTITSGPGFIGGNVTQGANKGTANGIEGLTILLLDANDNPVKFAITDANGDYSFDNLPNAAYKVHPEQLGYATTQAGIAVTVGQSSFKAVNFERSLKNKTIIPKSSGVTNVNASTMDFAVYPNPAKDMINIEWGNASEETANVTITDVTGKTVYTTQVKMNGKTTIQLNDVQPGLYILNVATDFSSNTQKLILR